MFKILIKTILDDFRYEKNFLFFAPNSSSKPDVVSYLEKTKNTQLLGLLLRFSHHNAIDVVFLIDQYGIESSQLARLKKGKSFRIENLEGKTLLLKPPK